MEEKNNIENKEEKESGPQIENGHIDIANELADVLAKTQLSGYESRILWALWRMTWGYAEKNKKGQIIYKVNKKGNRQPLKIVRASISSKKWERLTGLDKGNISKTLKRLCQRNIVVKNDNKYKSITWEFQKYYKQWLSWDFVVDLDNKNIVVKNNNNLLLKSITPVVEINNKIITKPLKNKADVKTKKTSLKKTYIKKEKKEDIYNLEIEEKIEEKEIFDFWNSLNIIEHKTFKLFEKDISEALKNYSLVEIKNTIKNYSLILKDEKYIYTYEHTISGFLDPKNFEKFKDIERAKKNYQVKRFNNKNDNENDYIPDYDSDKKKDIDNRTPEELKRDRLKFADLVHKEREKLNL